MPNTINEVLVGEHLPNLDLGVDKPAARAAGNPTTGKPEVKSGAVSIVVIVGNQLMGKVFLRKRGKANIAATTVVALVKDGDARKQFSDLTTIVAVFDTKEKPSNEWELVIENAAGSAVVKDFAIVK